VRVVPSIVRYAARRGQVPPLLAFGFAAFLQYMQGGLQASRRPQGLPLPADDQGVRLGALHEGFPADASAPVAHVVSTICGDSTLWGADLAAIPGFADAVADHLSCIRSQGVEAALERVLSS